MRRAFTLLEVLAATMLAAGIAVSASSWLLALQRSAGAVQRQSDGMRAVLLVANRLRTDLIHASIDRPVDPLRMEMLVGDAGGGERRLVAWTLHDGVATRATQALTGGPWTSEPIATAITAMTITRDDQGRLWLHVAAGAMTIDWPGTAESPRAP